MLFYVKAKASPFPIETEQCNCCCQNTPTLQLHPDWLSYILHQDSQKEKGHFDGLFVKTQGGK